MIPRVHHENLYTMPADAGHEVWDLTQQVATGRCGRRTDVTASPPDSTTSRVDAAARAPYAGRLADEIGLPRTFE